MSSILGKTNIEVICVKINQWSTFFTALAAPSHYLSCPLSITNQQLSTKMKISQFGGQYPPQHLPCPLVLGEKQVLLVLLLQLLKTSFCSVTNSSDGLVFVKRRAKDGRFFSKNTGVRRAKRRAKFKFILKKRVNSTRDILTTKVSKSTNFRWKFIWGKFSFNKSSNCFKMAQSSCYIVYLA